MLEIFPVTYPKLKFNCETCIFTGTAAAQTEAEWNLLGHIVRNALLGQMALHTDLLRIIFSPNKMIEYMQHQDIYETFSSLYNLTVLGIIKLVFQIFFIFADLLHVLSKTFKFKIYKLGSIHHF